MAKILVVEDDPEIAKSIEKTLKWEYHAVELSAHGGEALHLLKINLYDLVILDWNLPELTGLQILQEFRKTGTDTPVLMLTGNTGIDEKESGLDAGADDYLTKPFLVRELTARVRALLRRASGQNSNLLEVGGLVLDRKAGRVLNHGRVVSATPQETDLLEFLMRHKGQVFSADVLLARVWGSESDCTTDSVRQCVSRLRKKLEIEGRPSAIENIKGIGYRLADF